MCSVKCRKGGHWIGKLIFSGLVVVGLSSCSDMGYTGSGIDLPEIDTSKMSSTSLGATTGAVLGASVGTIIGSTSGNAGEGLVLGSMAGAAAGGAIGYGLEDTHEKMTAQQKALKDQQELLDRQIQEISELKGRLEDRGGRSIRSSKTLKKTGAFSARTSSDTKSTRGSDIAHSNSAMSANEDTWLDPKSLNTNSAGADAEDPDNPPAVRDISDMHSPKSSAGLSEHSINIPTEEAVDARPPTVAAGVASSAFPPARSGSQKQSTREDLDWVDESAKSSAPKDAGKKTRLTQANDDIEEGIKSKRARLALEKSESLKSKKLVEAKKGKEKASKVKAKELEELRTASLPSGKTKKELDSKKISKSELAKAEKSRQEEMAAKEEKLAKANKAGQEKLKPEKAADSSQGASSTTAAKAASSDTPKVAEEKSEKTAPVATQEQEVASKVSVSKDDPSCVKAEDEAKRASSSKSAADKLFYYRRALRVCPSEAKYHYEIGRVYSVIGRNEDAIYELRQALDLNPGMSEAKSELGKLGGQ